MSVVETRRVWDPQKQNQSIPLDHSKQINTVQKTTIIHSVSVAIFP